MWSWNIFDMSELYKLHFDIYIYIIQEIRNIYFINDQVFFGGLGSWLWFAPVPG